MGGSGVVIPSGWKPDGTSLRKTFLFPDFRTALDFVNRVAAAAGALGRHPDLHLAWGQVDVTASSRDFTFAEAVDRAYFQGFRPTV